MRRYRLMRGDALLGLVGVDGYRFHSVPCEGEGTFTPMPELDSVQPLLDRMFEFHERLDEFVPELWPLVGELIAPGLYLESEDGGRRVDLLWMFIKDERVWWFATSTMGGAEALRRARRRDRQERLQQQRRRKRRPPPDVEKA